MADKTLIRKCQCTTVSRMIQCDGCLYWHHVTCNMSDNQHQYFSGEGTLYMCDRCVFTSSNSFNFLAALKR
mgnify:FL=1